MTISVLIPTWRRPESLVRCLAALEAQERVPDELVLVVREDDEGTHTALESRTSTLTTVLVPPPRPGALAAVNAGLDRASCDIVAISDDDTEAHPDWLARIEQRYAADERLGGLGGRDRIVTPGFEQGPPQETVGTVLWFGRYVGYHSSGTGGYREVDSIKGANMSFRRAALGQIRADADLRGEGIEHHWEIDLSLAVKAAGWKIAYDPAILVDHHEAARPQGSREATMAPDERADTVHNQTYAFLKHLPPGRRLVTFLYELIVGSRTNPGPLLAAERLLAGEPRAEVATRLRAATAGRLAGLRSWRRWRRSRR